MIEDSKATAVAARKDTKKETLALKKEEASVTHLQERGFGSYERSIRFPEGTN